VRFLLYSPPDSEEEMETRSKTGSLPLSKNIYMPTDPVEEGQLKFPSARNWTKQHLSLLGVDFRRHHVDLNHLVMKVNESEEWTEEMRESIMIYMCFDCLDFMRGKQELEKVDLGVRKNYGPASLHKSAPHFSSFFEPLISLNTRQGSKVKEKEIREMKQQPITASSASRPHTPDQPIPPQNPDLSGSSTNSQDEDTTKKLVNQLLFSIMTVLDEKFYRVSWQQSGEIIELVSVYDCHIPAIVRADLLVPETRHVLNLLIGIERQESRMSTLLPRLTMVE
jgi:hypothetical protein